MAATNWREDYNRYQRLFWKNYNLFKERQDIKNYVELVLSLISIIIFAVFALRPTILTIIELNKEIKTKEETVKQMDTKIKNLQKAQNLINQEEDRINLLNMAVPVQPEPDTFLHTLAGTAVLEGLTVKSISLEEITLFDRKENNQSQGVNPAEEAKTITFAASFEGEFEKMMDFIKKSENLIRPIKFEQLSITQKKAEEEETEKTNLLNLSISGQTLYYPKNK